MILRFEGYSDDTFGECETVKDDYDNCASGHPIRWEVRAPDGSGLVVFGQYCPDGASGWVIGAGRLDDYDDDSPMPAWPMFIRHGEREYSPALVIEVPEGTTIKCLEASDDE